MPTTESLSTDKPARSFYIISGLALLWNLIGVITDLITVTMGPEAMSEMSEEQRQMVANTPAWVTGAYAIATWGGLLGSVALLMRKWWAVPLFVISLVGVLVQMGYTMIALPTIEMQGLGSLVFPLIVIAIAAALIWYSMRARQRGWIR